MPERLETDTQGVQAASCERRHCGQLIAAPADRCGQITSSWMGMPEKQLGVLQNLFFVSEWPSGRLADSPLDLGLSGRDPEMSYTTAASTRTVVPVTSDYIRPVNRYFVDD